MDAQVGISEKRGRNLREKSQNPPILAEMPDLLKSQLLLMRRNPAEFTVYSGAKCKFCYKRTAFDLSHPKSQKAGSWCPEHGWLHFDSVKVWPAGEDYTPKKRVKKEELL